MSESDDSRDKTYLWRLYTEDVNREKLMELVGTYTDGFTTIKAQGMYKGKREASLIIEIAGLTWAEIEHLIYDINKLNKQECVMVVKVCPIDQVKFI